MKFDYNSYKNLLITLRNKGYVFTDYHNYDVYPKTVILRHDVDCSLPAAIKFGTLEAEQGISATYFVLLTSDFYNLHSSSSRFYLNQLLKLGHKIGLHFDPAAYPDVQDPETMTSLIEKEIMQLSDIIQAPVEAFSFHRPLPTLLTKDSGIPKQLGNVINAYSETFFHEVKYLSDSRRRWREPVDEIIASNIYDRFQLLTHPFWYHAKDEDVKTTVMAFIDHARKERFHLLKETITDLTAYIQEEI